MQELKKHSYSTDQYKKKKKNVTLKIFNIYNIFKTKKIYF